MKSNYQKIEQYYLGLIIITALLLGGGTLQGLWSDHIIQIISIPSIILSTIYLLDEKIPRMIKFICIAILLILIYQFLPLSRAWPPISMSGKLETVLFSPAPGRSLEAAFFVLTALSWFLLFWRLPPDRLKGLTKFLFLGVALNVVAALLQLSSDQRVLPEVGLPYPLGAGLFANENHFSTMIFATIPFIALHFLHLRPRITLYFASCVVLIITLFAVGSRTGMLLGFTVFVYCIFWFGFLRERPYVKLALAGGGAAITILSLYVLNVDALAELGTRLDYSKTTFKAAAVFWPFGSGLGTFPYVYPMFEPVSQVTGSYTQRAHNDYLQIALEAGVPGVILMVLTIVLLLINFARTAFGQAAFLSILCVLTHSLIDYPLRSMAVTVIFVYSTCLILRPLDSNSSPD